MKKVPVTTHRPFAEVLEEQVSPTSNLEDQSAVAESGSSDSDGSVNQYDLACSGSKLGWELRNQVRIHIMPMVEIHGHLLLYPVLESKVNKVDMWYLPTPHVKQVRVSL